LDQRYNTDLDEPWYDEDAADEATYRPWETPAGASSQTTSRWWSRCWKRRWRRGTQTRPRR